MRTWLILLVSFLAAHTLVGGTRPDGDPQNPCAGAPSDEYRPCIFKAAEDADKELNRVYKQLIAQVTKEDAKRLPQSNGVKIKYGELLREAQRAWVTFIDKEGDLRCGPMEGGSGQPLCYADWRAVSTVKRTNELKAYLQDREWGAPLEQHK